MQFKIILLFLAIALAVGACGRPATDTPTAVPTDTPIPTPTATPTPSTPLAILLLPTDMDQEASGLYQTTVYNLAQESGFRFQVRNTLSPADLADPMLKVVIAFPPDPGIASAAVAAPQAQFLAVNIPNLTAGGNISVLSPSTQVDLPAFMAGYVGAMITEEHHIGMILPAGNADAQRAYNAFSNGMAFYCGLCRTFYLTTYGYPQYIEIPAEEDPSRYGGYANVLIADRDVYLLYVYPDLATDEFLSFIGTTGTMLIGTSMPEPRPGGWVMTLQPDIAKAIQSAWPNLLAGQGGVNVQSPLGFADADPALLSPGKQRLAQQVLDDLLAGRISTGSP